MLNNIKIDALKKKLIAFSREYGDKKTVDTFEGDILELKNANLSCWFATHINCANIPAHEKIVIDSNDAYLCYEFAVRIKGANVKSLGNVVINSKILELNEKMKRIIGSDREAHQKVIDEIQISESYNQILKIKRIIKIITKMERTKAKYRK